MIKLSRAEIKWLKGFNEIELERYLEEFPKRKETTEEFKRRYTYKKDKWVRNGR